MSDAIPVSAASDVISAAGTTYSRAAKRRQHLNHEHDQERHQRPPLLPGLPDHVAQICLSRVPPSVLYSVCRSWRCLIYSPSFPPFLSIYALLLSKGTVDQTHHLPDSLRFCSFDPVSSKWQPLPLPPADPPLRLIRHHPSFLSRNLSIQSITVSGKLVLLAATTDQFLPALPRPLIFNPLTQKWTFGPSFSTPRRWCVAGTVGCVVYVASGIGSHYSTEVARSAEKWDLKNRRHQHRYNRQRSDSGCSESDWEWVKLGGLRDGRFSREAIEAIGWRGKLCMVNVKGDAAKEGIIYDVKSNEWENMPEGMLAGWRGPATAMDEETIYVVDESKGSLRRYDQGRDRWVDIMDSEKLRGAEHIACGGGRVCVACGGGGAEIVVVDVVAKPPRLWVMDTPPGFETVAIHILPRMSQQGLEPPVPDSSSID